MAQPVNKPGHPPGVTVLNVSKERDVAPALRGSREIVARNVPLISKVMIVRNVYRTTTGMTAVIIFNCFYYDYYIFLNKTLLPHRNDDCKPGVSNQK